MMVFMPRTAVPVVVAVLAVVSVPCLPVLATEADALAVSANIRALHMPFGTILNPIYASPTSDQIIGYSRCGDSALWTGAYLAAESFRYGVTQSPAALDNVKTALAGLKSLLDVTGDNRLARCIVAADSPWAAGIQSEEASNTIHSNPPWIWVDNTSRDQVVGVFFGLGAAYDLVNDSGVRSAASDAATRLIGFIARHQWSPNDDLSSTFLLRPEQLQMLLQVARHVNPSNTISGPFLVPPVNVGVLFDVQSISSYFKFNLDYMTFFHLVQLQNNDDNRGAYTTLRSYTASHQNAFFNLIDRALNGAAAARDQETRVLIEQWLQRPRRDFSVDLTGQAPACGSEACQPVPVPLRPPADFLWQDDPFQLSGGGSARIETSGVDYILPYWMARYYGVISAGVAPTIDTSGVHSVANGSTTNPPGSLIYATGTNMASQTLVANSTPLALQMQTSTDDVSVTVNGITVPMYYITPTAVSLQLPWETATGTATMVVTRNGVESNAMTFQIGQFSPGIYTTNGVGTGMAWAIFASTSKLNSKAQVAQSSNVSTYVGGAATAGDILYIYAAGLGPPKDSTKAVDGQAPCPLTNSVPGPCPAGYNASDYATLNTPVVTIGGTPAKVNASILDPTYPGLYLVFFTVPAGTPTGSAVPIQLEVGGVTTPNDVTIAIQ